MLRDGLKIFLRMLRLNPHPNLFHNGARKSNQLRLLELLIPLCRRLYATVRAASAAGTIMTLSSWDTSSVEEVASTGPGIRFFQLYVYGDRNVVAQLVRRAERAGFKAIALTLDTPILGRREVNIKNRFTLPPFLTLKNFEGLDLGKMNQIHQIKAEEHRHLQHQQKHPYSVQELMLRSLRSCQQQQQRLHQLSFSSLCISIFTDIYLVVLVSFNTSSSTTFLNNIMFCCFCFCLGLAITLALLGIAASFAGKAYGQVGQGIPIGASGLALVMDLNLLEIDLRDRKALEGMFSSTK